MNFTNLYNLAESKFLNISQENYAPLLSPEIREKAIFFFKRYPNGNKASSHLNWRNHKDFTDEDFKFLDDIINTDNKGNLYFTQKSDSEIKKANNKERFNVEKTAEDIFRDKPDDDLIFHIYPEISNEDWLFVAPLTVDAATYINSRECGLGGACWCIGCRDTDSYWNDYTENGSKFVLAFNKKFRTLENTKIDGVPFLKAKDKNGNPVTPNTLNKWGIRHIQENGFDIEEGDPCTYQDLFTKLMIQVEDNNIKVWIQPNKEYTLNSVQDKFGINFGVTKDDILNLDFKEFNNFVDPEYGRVFKLRAKGYEVDDDLTKVTIPDGVTEIKNFTFDSCVGLTSISIPESVTKIGVAAFSWCSSLKNINIPKGVNKIEKYTFYGCTGLIHFSLPDSVKEIGKNVFNGCTSLKTLIIPVDLDVSKAAIPKTCKIIRRGNSDNLAETKTKLFENIYKRFN